jgi:hypothetical protein
MRLKSILTTLFVAAVLVVGIDYTSYAANGSHVFLGKINKAGKATTFQRTKAGPPVSLVAKPGSAPLGVNSTTRVPNLNADLLDGADSESFARKQAPVNVQIAPSDPDRWVAVPASPAVVMALSVNVPAECGAATRHKYLVQHEAWWESESISTLELSLTSDSTSHQFGDGTAVEKADPYASTATSRVVTLGPGAHVLRLVAHMSPAGYAWDPSFRATDLGYTC